MVTRALVIAIVVCVAGTALAIPPPPVISVPARRFDHKNHESAALTAKDAKRSKAVCADCHQMDALGKRRAGKEHGFRCVKCHNDPATCTADMKTSSPTSPGRRCVTCHEMKLCKPPNLPPTPPKTFQANFNHPAHIGFGASIERDCANCHTQQAPAGAIQNTAAGAAHASCSDCHKAGGRSNGKAVMTDCASCHKPPVGRAVDTNPWRLATFDHQKHHSAATRNQAPCTSCHTLVKESANGQLPRPAMKSCLDQCHNGAKAFSAVGTSCTKCHTAQNGKPVANDRTQVFSHEKHRGRNVDMKNCAACHSIKQDGNLDPPGEGKNHMPCAASGCHQTEYLTKTTKICGVCHDQSMPWQKALARMNDHGPNAKSEYYNTINHNSHLAKKGTTNSACGDCHGDKLGGGKRPHDHEPCVVCHGKGAPAHDMTECGKCHLASAPNRAAETEWSVAATFDHRKHAVNPKTKATSQCQQCHADVRNAKDLAGIKNPTMQSCDSCHDGKISFKTTGYECSKCHTRAKPAAPVAMVGVKNGLAMEWRRARSGPSIEEPLR